MTEMKWLAYNDLAWTESLLASPEDVSQEVTPLIETINAKAERSVSTILHLGCGAGAYDFSLKQHYSVTGVDISQPMLDMATRLNPEVMYMQGDMRDIKLDSTFDAVIIPDAIAYMSTRQDLVQAINTACQHLSPEGLLLIVTSLYDNFQENNFVYTGSADNTEVTLFENNTMLKNTAEQYEATLVYLIRQYDALDIYTDRHRLGLFSRATWVSLLQNAGLEVTESSMGQLYDRYLMSDSEYPLSMFVCNPA